MNGPEIFVRSLSRARIPDKFGNFWQYHSRSDQHSKIACWGVLFDLLRHCPLLAEQARAGKVGFGINHEMKDFRVNRKKNLDLVICTPGPGTTPSLTFSELAEEYGVLLSGPEAEMLRGLPKLNRVPVGTVHMALEAKACMTAHIKALPRLYDELNSSHAAIHGSAEYSIAVGLSVVNSSTTFYSTDKNKFKIGKKAAVESRHRQPQDTVRAVAKLMEIPSRTHQNTDGFDALGIIVVDIRNDGSDAHLISTPPAPPEDDICHYGQMIRRTAGLYSTKFGAV